MSYELGHYAEYEGLTLEVIRDCPIKSLRCARNFLQYLIDAQTPKLEEPEGTTCQMAEQDSPTVKEAESEPEWSPWFDWSGEYNPVGECVVRAVRRDGMEFETAKATRWNWYIYNKEYDITHYRVLLSTIPAGWSLIDGRLVEDLPQEAGQ